MNELTQTINKLRKIQNRYNRLTRFKSADAIAKFLQKQKIKGIIGDHYSCPIVKYFTVIAPDGEIIADGSLLNFYVDGCAFSLKVELGSPIQQFITRFDNQLYPDLILGHWNSTA